MEKADWREFAHVKATFASADQVNDLVVFNVGGNKYRVVAFILFKPDRPAWIYIKHVVTHQEYDDLDLGGET